MICEHGSHSKCAERRHRAKRGVLCAFDFSREMPEGQESNAVESQQLGLVSKEGSPVVDDPSIITSVLAVWRSIFAFLGVCHIFAICPLRTPKNRRMMNL
jgi:hypothetical protein